MSTTTVPEPPTTLTLPPQQAARLLTTFTHFLTVSIHNILFYRGLYPEPTFLTSRAYNLPVHQSRHPAVCAWIRDAVDAASVQLAAGAVERLAVVIYGPESVPGTGTKDPESKGSASSTGGSSSNGKGAGVIKVLERWMFDVAGFPTWKKSSKDKKGKGKEVERDRERELAEDEPEEEDALEGGEEAATKINWTNIDEQLRAAIRRLAYAGEKIAALPEGCTFTVAVELRNEAEAPIGHPQPWIPSQPSLQPKSKDQPKPGTDVGGARTTPLRAVEASPLFFECWVEESKAKTELTDPSTVMPPPTTTASTK